MHKRVQAILKVYLPMVIVAFWVQTAFAQTLINSEELSLDLEGIIYPLTIKPEKELGLLRKEDDIFIVKNGKEFFLASTEAIVQHHVIPVTFGGDDMVYFFVLNLEGLRNSSKIYSFVDELGKNVEKKLLGKRYNGLAGVNVDDETSTISSFIESNPDCPIAAGLRFVFTPTGVNVIEEWSVSGTEGGLTRTDSWHKNRPGDIKSELAGEPFNAVIREKTYIAVKPGGTLTKKYLVQGDNVLVSDVSGYWIKISYAKSKVTGWIDGNAIEPGW